MKKIIAATILAMGSASVMAAGPAGCGLGTAVVFQDANEWHEHVLAATTNGTSGNQTFGMTSGTLGCEAANGPLKNGIALFIDKNIDRIAADTARGEGESLDTLAAMMGVNADDQLAFRSTLQQNFDAIFSTESTVSADAIDAMVTALRSNEQLKKYVS